MKTIVQYDKRSGPVFFFTSDLHGGIALNLREEKPYNTTLILALRPGDKVRVELKTGGLETIGGQPYDIAGFLEKIEVTKVN